MATPTSRALELESIASEWISRFPAAAPRIVRGLQLAKAEGAVLRESADCYRVKGSEGFYAVTRRGCSCQDSQKRGGLRCKHMWAASLVAKLEASAPQVSTVKSSGGQWSPTPLENPRTSLRYRQAAEAWAR